MTLDDLDTSLDQAPVKEPSKRWRNRYKTRNKPIEILCLVCKYTRVFPGESIFENHCRVYPSKEVAEEKGYEETAKPTNSGRFDYVESFSID